MTINRVIKDFKTDYDEDMEFYYLKCMKKTLSYGGDITMFYSPRNYGKSYAAMDLCLEAMEQEWNVAWERWTMAALGEAIETWQKHCPKLELRSLKECPTKVLWHPDLHAGIYCVPYANSDNVKGIDVPFKWEVKDEFVPERYVTKTRLDIEYETSMSIRKSLKRAGPMRSIYLANCIHYTNPYTIAWNLTPTPRGTIRKVTDKTSVEVDGEVIKTNRTYVTENIRGTSAIIRRNIQADFVAAESSDELSAYYDNEAVAVEYARVGQCPDMSVQPVNIQIMHGGYVMSWRILNGVHYIFHGKQRLDTITYVSEAEWVDPSRRQLRNKDISLKLEKLFDGGRCCFDSANTVQFFMRFIWASRRRM